MDRTKMQPGAVRVLACALLLLLVNVAITWKLFGLEYSAYNGSIEWSMIAIPRLMAKFPGQRQWWPFWNGGLPFEDVYLPFSHWLMAGFIMLTRFSAARSFHIVTASVFVGGPVAMFWMAWEFSRRLGASLMAGLIYSCVSISALLVPAIGSDVGGVLNLRRLHVLVFYGEAPHTVALALLPVAVICFARALNTRQWKWQVLAAVAGSCVLLSNAYGLVMLPVALVCWLLSFPLTPWWRAPLTVAVLGILTYCWISPWLSPSMLRAIHENAATVGGDYRYTAHTWTALVLAVAGFLMLWLALRQFRISGHMTFFLLLAYVPTVIVVMGYAWKAAMMPQPHRYHLEMDMMLAIAAAFAGAALLDRIPARARLAVMAVAIGLLGLQTVHSVLYANRLIQSVQVEGLSEYQIAKWLDTNRPGERAFLCGSASSLYNVFTDNPQLTGGFDQHTVNRFLPIVEFTIYTDMNAGDHGADYSLFWLKAFGAHLISVPGADSTDAYKAGVVHPRKFDGILPVLWRSGDGTAIYEVPARSKSLAHVIPTWAVVKRTPIHGLDTAPVHAYVAALEDGANPPAEFRWKNLGEAEIQATLGPGQVISVQETYERGWEAWANGKPQRVFGDALGQIVIAPECQGACTVSLRYTGGWEHRATRSMSLGAMLLAVVMGWKRKRDSKGVPLPAC